MHFDVVVEVDVGRMLRGSMIIEVVVDGRS